MSTALLREVLKKPVWAVVGASSNPQKYGHKVYKHLKQHGYTVYPVNPNASEIDGDRVYATLNELPEQPDVVNFVVPPAITNTLLETLAALDIRYAWCQPGASDSQTAAIAEQKGITLVKDSCVLVLVPWID